MCRPKSLLQSTNSNDLDLAGARSLSFYKNYIYLFLVCEITHTVHDLVRFRRSEDHFIPSQKLHLEVLLIKKTIENMPRPEKIGAKNTSKKNNKTPSFFGLQSKPLAKGTKVCPKVSSGGGGTIPSRP